MIISTDKKGSVLIILLSLFLFISSSRPKPALVAIHTIDNRSYVSMMELVKRFDLRFTYDMDLQRGRFYHDRHTAVFSVGFPVMICDGILIKSEYETMRHKGMVLLPADSASRMMKLFFPDLSVERGDGNLKFFFADAEVAPDEKKDPVKKTRGRDRITFIVIDAGHGGKDPGAIGKKNLREKNITLDISKAVESELKTRFGKRIKIVMTRKSDRFVELADRTRLANRLLKKGENGFFVSIHINASISPKANGFETYFLSQNPSNEEARKTAALENDVIVLEEKKNSGAYEETDFIEAMMMTNQIQRESALLAGSIQTSAKRSVRSIKSKGVKKADFFVLRGVLMPATLVEAGYITNAKDASYLRVKKNRQAVAKAVADGIESFLKEYERGITPD